MAAYNHEAFVLEAVDSVLSQRGVDLEVLIEDDGSKDNTPAMLKNVRDSRVNVITKARNEGAYATHNNLLRRARGEFIAVINSDDVWRGSDKLAYQLDILQSDPHIGASFGQPAYIGPDGLELDKDATFSGRIFEEPNRPQARWLRRFFESGNCLCHPTVVIRRECHERLGLYDNRLRQIADYDMWVRLIKHWNVHNSDRELVNFRVVSGGNTSWPSERNTRRLRNEEYLTAKRLLDDVTLPLLQEAFGDVLIAPDISSPAQMEVEKALLYFRSEGLLRPLYWMIGLEKVHALLGDQGTRDVLADYGIGDTWLHDQMGEFTVFPVPQQPIPEEPAPSPVGVAQDMAPSPAAPHGRKLPLARYLSFLRR